jgi:hypothetical protein
MAANINLVVGSLLSTSRRLAEDAELVEAFTVELERKVTDLERRGLRRLRDVLDGLLADDVELVADEVELERATPEEVRAAIIGAAVTWTSNDLAGHVLTSVGTYRGVSVRRRTDKNTRAVEYAVRLRDADPWEAFRVGDELAGDVEVDDAPAEQGPTDDELVDELRGASVVWTSLGIRDGVKWHRATWPGVVLTRAVVDGRARYEVRRGDASPYPLVVDDDASNEDTRRLEGEDL